ncbi:hypothetical protein PhCBS80983_g02176 [Powellomyces hirtus]|uniref:Calcium/calmodulin-dependent protein kinase II association-domain domain-containing protein n=1 Tax=Powellomyces hirtus TaxID=109895 RepID=A0A507E7I6_9FUNG|nr:hypothetical protein PhCBS80983_g02176 [Powellomyces hirtus]
MPPLPSIFTDTKTEKVLIDLTAQLLQSIAHGDWDTYARLCSHDVTAFEPEAGEHQVQGLDFHKFFFDLDKSQSSPPPPYEDSTTGVSPALPPPTTTLVSPHVRFLSSDRTSALITYVRLVQRATPTGGVTIKNSQETRVWEWEKKDSAWKCVHVHRSNVNVPVPAVVQPAKKCPCKAKL